MKILIAGGGIGGVTAALCLAKKGHEIEVFEQASEFGEVGAGIQLSPNCSRVLHYLGLEEALRRWPSCRRVHSFVHGEPVRLSRRWSWVILSSSDMVRPTTTSIAVTC